MSKNRRDFIRTIGFAGVSIIGLRSFGLDEIPLSDRRQLSILHTNDMHSHIDPFAVDDSKYPNLGGMANRASMVKAMRMVDPELLLLDCGDVFQGTPFFNYFGGGLELELMSAMGYDASTIGNHEFDGGMEGFVKAQEKASFPFITANYDFSDTPMADSTIARKVLVRNGLRIGIFGLGVELEGLVDPRLYGDTRYLDPITIARQEVDLLRNEMDCDLVICLSHLGYAYESDKVSDLILAGSVPGIDVILGGHTHTFLDRPTVIQSGRNTTTWVNQVGWAGVHLGHLRLSVVGKKVMAEPQASAIDIHGSHG